MGKATSRLQAATAALMLAIFAFFGAQPAVATDVDPVPSTEQPGETPKPDPNPIDPLPVDPVPGNPVPVVPPVTPVQPSPAPVESSPAPAPVPDPVAPPVAPVVPPVVEPANPQPLPTMLPEQVPGTATQDAGEVANLEAPVETETPAVAIPSPTPTPVASKSANPPVAAADIAGPLKVALAPVAENNPLIQGVTVLVLILLGVVYFRALRSKGVPGPRLNGK